jgi:hypothetical protein
MQRLFLACRSFFAILFRWELPADIVSVLQLDGKGPKAPAQAEKPLEASNGALQMLALLQRDARLVDFLMEDISQYTDEQVGASVRSLHEQCGKVLSRYVNLEPVIDGVEGGFTNLEADSSGRVDPSRVKLLGNVPVDALPTGGLLRHKGWRAEKVELPPLDPRHNLSIVAPAEIEIE